MSNQQAEFQALLQSQIAGMNGITVESALQADWNAVHESLIQAREHLQKGGVRHTWLDGAIGIAESRKKAPIPDAYLRQENSAEPLNASSGPEDSPQSSWDRDDVQFPRLIAEINATQDSLDLGVLATSMDLSTDEVQSLFDRADQAWESIKGNATPQIEGRQDRPRS